ncbi:XK-related protein 9-like isoform X2 [Branchiostoma floridae]|nr:XK-related protein 9-like isoform X2 [Branchiostoma floridae]
METSFWESKHGKILWLVVLPLGLYIIDISTDIGLAFQFYNSGQMVWFGWMMGFIVVPSAIINITLTEEAFKHHDGENRLSKNFKYLLNYLRLGVFVQYYNLYRRLQRGESVEDIVKKDLPLTHLLEAVFSNMPQLYLQWYIILNTTEQISALQVATMVISYVAAVKAHSMYIYMYFRKHRPLDIRSIFLCICIASLEVYARGLAMATFLKHFKPRWIFIPIGIHWLVFTGTYMCIHARKGASCEYQSDSTTSEDISYKRIIQGLVHLLLYTFLGTTFGAPHLKMIFLNFFVTMLDHFSSMFVNAVTATPSVVPFVKLAIASLFGICAAARLSVGSYNATSKHLYHNNNHDEPTSRPSLIEDDNPIKEADCTAQTTPVQWV